jgi:MYXO-CTERM domain-containing protein
MKTCRDNISPLWIALLALGVSFWCEWGEYPAPLQTGVFWTLVALAGVFLARRQRP